ncbi:MAG: type II toxin-antitoxin system Phd/YefM family antitoxin [Bifidobacteriaceae bacterium]|jgi:prevent-host-death family protein|nr:type II toxin-antitoxin system Phd/YefM family antitoxin [Bifidobacteriaceae bacterium]
MSVSDARSRFAEAVDLARVGHEPVYLTRRNRRIAALIEVGQLDRLMAGQRSGAPGEATARTDVNEERARALTRMGARNRALIGPGVEPLTDPSGFYRDPPA